MGEAAERFPLVVHATHEAGLTVGGIGAVLNGLLTAPGYSRAIGRTVLAGPFNRYDPAEIRTAAVAKSRA
ncbi:MAG: hypothetical protein KatS3mg057_3196 [Herpetosiphonaceae bacterium]|nr:MAG: hypothetical protein KatS3mg057_3196 [Herpetosiphonaceae bacterium]